MYILFLQNLFSHSIVLTWLNFFSGLKMLVEVWFFFFNVLSNFVTSYMSKGGKIASFRLTCHGCTLMSVSISGKLYVPFYIKLTDEDEAVYLNTKIYGGTCALQEMKLTWSYLEMHRSGRDRSSPVIIQCWGFSISYYHWTDVVRFDPLRGPKGHSRARLFRLLWTGQRDVINLSRKTPGGKKRKGKRRLVGDDP